MKIVNLVGRDSLSLEQRESYVGESSALCCAGRPVFPGHDTVVGCRTAEGDAVSLVVGSHAREGAAAGYLSLEMVNVGRFQIWPGRLVMAAVLVQPRNWIRFIATVGGHRMLFREGIHRGRKRQRERGQDTRFQHITATAGWAGVRKEFVIVSIGCLHGRDCNALLPSNA
jgi:hypothetical protein